MKAVAIPKPGPPEALEMVEVEKPAVPDDGVLVLCTPAGEPARLLLPVQRETRTRVLAERRRPGPQGVGHDFTGTVEWVGDGNQVVQPAP